MYMFLIIGFHLFTAVFEAISPHNTTIYLFPLFFCQPILYAYFRPCKLQLMNASLTFHTAVINLMIVLLLVWVGVVDTDPQLLATFITLLLLLPHTIFIIFILYCVLQQSRFLKAFYHNKVAALVKFSQ